MTDEHTTIAAIRAELRAFNDARQWAPFHSPRNCAMALSVEAAELLELYLWSSDGQLPSPDRAPRVEAEAADVAICLLNFCEAAGIDLAGAVARKLEDNAARYPVESARGRAAKWDEL